MKLILKNKETIDILAKFFIIIMIIFLCYRNLTLREEIGEYYASLSHMIYEEHNKLPELIAEEAPLEAVQDKPIYKVYITGEVNNPGMYIIENGMRVADVIELAGGASQEADLESINLAAYVDDARHLRIPPLEKDISEAKEVFVDTGVSGTNATASESSSSQYEKPAYTGPVNINTADIDRLTSLPGIGQAIANSIIEYRKENGGFKSIDELKNVNRIGDSLFNNIKDIITY